MYLNTQPSYLITSVCVCMCARMYIYVVFPVEEVPPECSDSHEDAHRDMTASLFLYEVVGPLRCPNERFYRRRQFTGPHAICFLLKPKDPKSLSKHMKPKATRETWRGSGCSGYMIRWLAGSWNY